MKLAPSLLKFLLSTSLIAFSTLHASTLYWDGNNTSANADGGAGTWDTSSTNWDSLEFGGANASWNNATPDSAVFGRIAGTVTLGSSINVGNIQFNTTAYTINSAAFPINFPGSSGIAFNNIASATITGAVGGAGNVSLSAIYPTTAGTLNLNGISAGGWNGSTTLNAGMTMALSGDNQALLSTSGIILNGGAVTLTNADNDTQVILNRVSDSANITSNGGTITYTNTTAASTRASAETIGPVALTFGQLNIVQGLNKSAGSQVLTLSGLTQSGTASVSFSNAGGLNTTNDQVVVTGATATATGQIIGPWATTGTTAAAQTDFAVYNASAQVVPRAVAASAETTWTTAANTYTLSAATTLTATRTFSALRYTGAAATLGLGAGAFNLQTYGILNGGSGLLTISTTGTGGVTTPSGGGSLYLNAGSNAITISAPINNNGGAVALVKNGSGVLTLSSITSNFSGGVVLNAGTLTTSADTNLGNSSNSITVNGSVTLNTSGTYARNLIINNGAIAVFGNVNPTFTGNVTGSGGLAMNTGFGAQPVFNGTANTFEGPIFIGSTGTTSQAYRFSFASLADSSTANGRISFISSYVTHANGSVFEYSGTSNLVLNHRQIELASATGNPINGHQIRRTGTGTLTINTDVIVRTGAPQSLSLAGANTTGVNTFNSAITDSLTPTIGSTPLDVAYAIGASSATLGSVNGIVVGASITGTGIAAGTTITAINPLTRVVTLSAITTAAGAIGQAMTIPGVYNPISLIKADASTWVLNGTNTYSGNTTISGGTLQLSGASSLGGGAYAGLIVNAGTLTYSSSANQVLSGAISGVGTLNKNTSTASTLTLASGASSFSGPINLSAGTLVASATATSGSTSAFGQPSNARTITVGAGTFLRFDSGNVMSGTYSATNIPTIAATDATVTNNFANNNALGNVTLNNSTLTATAGSPTYGAFNINGTVTSTGDSLISSSEPIAGRMMLTSTGAANVPTQNTINVTSGTLTISAPLAEVTRESKLSGLAKTGTGTLVLSGANTYSGGTTVNAGTLMVDTGGTLGAATSTLSVNGVGTILDLATAADTSVGSLSGTGASTINNGGSGRNFTVHQFSAASFAGVIAGDGNFTLGSLSTNTLTLSGSPTYTGSTAVNAGTLRLDYSLEDTSKLSDSAALILGGGTLDLSGGTHTEIVSATTLTAGTASRITSTTPGAVLQMNAITAGAAASIDFAVNNIASTDTLNTNGILGTWATVGGSDWATNSTNSADGLIVAYTGYTDVARQTAGTIADDATSNVRIIEGTGSNSITLGSAITTINSLNQSTSGGTSAATIDLAGQTLRANSILVASGAGVLTVASGTLSSATAGGDLALNNSSSNDLNVNAVIANNTSATSLSKTGAGSLILTAANTYTGATLVNAGSLVLDGSINDSAITVNGTALLTENSTGVISGSSIITLASSATSTLAGANTHNGGTTVNSGNLVIGHASALGTGTFTLGGGNFNTDGSVVALSNNVSQNWNANFTYGGASSLDLGTGAVTLNHNAKVTVSANTLTVGGVISGAFGITKAGNGSLNLTGANAHSGGVTLGDGTLILGNASALGTGTFTINGNSNTIDSSIPNFVNANNNPQNWFASFTVTGSENINLGTGAVTMLGNRTVTVSANTLTVGGAISGPGFNLTKAGAGSMILSGVSTYTGNTIINEGSLTINGAGSLGSGNYAGSITNNGTLTHASSASQTVSGQITGAGSLTKSGSGTLVLTNLNIYSGGTTINDNSGILQANVSTTATALGTGAVTIGTGSTLLLNNTNNSGTTTAISSTISGAGLLKLQFNSIIPSNTTLANITGLTGSIQLSTASTTGDKWNATGSGTVTASLLVDSGAAMFVSSGTVSFTNGITLNGAGNTEGRGAIRLGNATLDGNIVLGSSSTISMENVATTLTGTISSGAAGTQVLTLGGTGSAGGSLTGIIGEGTGTIDLVTAVAGTYTLTNANTYTGTTTIGAGTSLRLGNGTTGNDGSIANPAGLVNNGTLVINYFDDVTWSTVISGTGGLTKQGAAVLTLSAANTYSGATTLSAGTLKLAHIDAVQSTSGGTMAIGTTLHFATDTAFPALPTLGGSSGATAITFISDRATSGAGLVHSLGTPNLGSNTFNFTKGANVASGTAGITLGGIGMTSGGAGTTTLYPVDATVSVTGLVSISNNSALKTLALSGENTGNEISGNIENGLNTISLSKLGTSTWTLSGANTYTGSTTVNGGTLQMNGSYDVAGGGTTSQLLIGSGASTNGTMTVGSSAGTITFGGNGYANAAQVGISGGTGALTLNGGTVNLAGTAGSTAASLNIGVQIATSEGIGIVTVNNGTLNVGQRILMGANNILSSGTLTVAGGIVNVGTNGTLGYTGNNPGVIFFGNGTSTVNLDDGTLQIYGFKSHDSGISTINFNGGTLVALGSPTYFLGNNGHSDTAPSGVGIYNTVVKSEGAIIDTNGFNITIPTSLVFDPLSTGGGLAKNNTGTLTLTGANTYTGATTVNAGTLALVGGSQASPISVSSGASLGFTLESPTTSSSTFNLSTGTIKITGTPTLASYDLITSSSGITGTPVLDAPISGYQLKVDGNSLKLVKAGYAAWAAINAIGSSPNQDKDGDGVPNAVEYVLGGSVITNDLSKLPQSTISGTNLIFTFQRKAETADIATEVKIEVGTDLATWPGVFNVGADTDGSTPGVVVTEGDPFDTITLTVPMGTDPKKFARLYVKVTE